METISAAHMFEQAPSEDEEREAFKRLNPAGSVIRHPPPPHELDAFQTSDQQLFQTIHMGAAEVDPVKWKLVVNGLVDKPFSIGLTELYQLPPRTLTSFHECYGNPLVPPTKSLLRVGNVTWTGVPLRLLLGKACPQPTARFAWSEGLDRGSFGGIEADRYQKDLPLEKALSPEVLVAYAINSHPLDKNRGGPVRLIVPGWFGTNSTKWLSKITLQDRRAPGHFTTTFYNEKIPDDRSGATRPVWKAQINSMIVKPSPNSNLKGPIIEIEGWSWGHDDVESVHVSVNDSGIGSNAHIEPRTDFSWQKFNTRLVLSPGSYSLTARATSKDGSTQPLQNARNHVHRVSVNVTE